MKEVVLLEIDLISKFHFIDFSGKFMKLKSKFQDQYMIGTAVSLTYTNKVVLRNVFDKNTGFIYCDFC